MRFKYEARTKEGIEQVGYVEAGSLNAAMDILTSHDLYVLSLVEAEKTRFYDRIGSFFGGVKRKDIVVFTRQLATLLEARLPLNDSLKTLSEQSSNPVLREAVLRMSQDIDSGLSFSQALERQSSVFSEFFASMVRSAEVTGNLDEVIGFLADYYEEEAILVGKARSAMIYPIVVLFLFIAVVIVMVTFVFPQLRPIFEQSNVELPALTKILLGSGDFIIRFWYLIILALLSIVAMGMSYVRTPEGKALLDDLKLRLPIVSRVYLPTSIARFSNAAAILIRGGVPISQAMEIVSHVVDNVLYRDILHEAAEAVRQGEQLSQAMSRHPDYIPSIVPQMLVVGETTGQIDKIFSRLAGYYKREADVVVNNIVDLIQPALMVFLGIMVGILFASVLMPIYKLSLSFGG